MIDATNNEAELTEKLLSFLTDDEKASSPVADLIEHINIRLDEIDDGTEENVVRVFLSVGDRMVHLDDSPPFGVSADSKIVFLLLDLVDDIDTEDRADVLTSAIVDGDSPAVAMELTLYLAHQHGDYGEEPDPEEERLLTRDEVNEMKEATAQKIQEYADDDRLLSIPKTWRILKNWSDFDGSDAPNRYARSKTDSRDEFLDFLAGFLLSSALRTSGSFGVTERFYVDPRWLDPYLDIEDARERIEGYDLYDLDDSQRMTVEKYREGWSYLDDGQDPSSAETWHFSERPEEE
ncbi:hypothetical protein ACFQE1_00315 [Halobium palmae]|uniref:Uncharacterized protein n=1 Tax=Halobium palmae TaxID=1776492 RepID=A0ABD5RUG3_9EURY